METPSSNRMVTRSQAGADISSVSSSQESDVKSRQRKSGQALIDITNDSPIVGLTSGSLKTPLKSARMGRSTRTKVTMTPGSGEALLRGQVKNLLQMVEEESELPKLPRCPFVRNLTALSDSPITLLAPANTPQIPSSGDVSGLELPAPIVQGPVIVSQAVNDAFGGRKTESFDSRGGPVTRSLMLEFLEKDNSDVSECYSTVTVGGESGGKGKSLGGDDDDDDDNDDDDDVDSSIWSMQVNARTMDEDTDEVIYKDVDEYEDEYAEQDVDDEELCSGMSYLSVNGRIGGLPLFNGKHTRFVYDSDDEEEMVEEDVQVLMTTAS